MSVTIHSLKLQAEVINDAVRTRSVCVVVLSFVITVSNLFSRECSWSVNGEAIQQHSCYLILDATKEKPIWSKGKFLMLRYRDKSR